MLVQNARALLLICMLAPVAVTDAAAQSKNKGPALGVGCKSRLMTLVEDGVAVAKGCSLGRNRWRFWCPDGSLYRDDRSCANRTVNLQVPEGVGCKSDLMRLVENGVFWGKGCSIGTGQWRFWCSSGRVYDEIHPNQPPPGGLGKQCDPAVTQSATAINPQPPEQSQAVAAAPGENSINQCVQQILSRNRCGPFLAVKAIRKLSNRGAGNNAVLVAEIDFETIQEFEVRSTIATNCTGTWWKEDPRVTRRQFSFPEVKHFVKAGQVLTLRKTFVFQRNDFGWRCEVPSMKPVEDAFVR